MKSKTQLPEGAKHELDFWARFIHSEQFATWLAPVVTPELDSSVVEFMRPIIKEGGTVLDVASGVVSVLNGFVPQEQLICADVLGDEYRKIFDYKAHNILAPLPTPAEELPFTDVFNIAHIRNGLDHCQDVRVAFAQMCAAVKPGGYVIVQGFENEATAENWHGFHQTNLYLSNDNPCIMMQRENENPIALTNAKVEYEHSGITYLPNGKTWFIWIGKKIYL